MFFEEHPWLLVPIIVATVEAWTGLKLLVRACWVRRRPAAQTTTSR